MHHHPSVLGFAFGALFLASCQGGDVLAPSNGPPPSLTPVSGIVNAIKCELAETFLPRQLPDGRTLILAPLIVQDPKGADVIATLSLSNVVANARSGEGGFETPIGGVSIGPSVSGSRSKVTEQSYELKFSYDLTADQGVPAFCATNSVKVAGDPFVDMLHGITLQYEALAAGEPKVKLGSIAYSSKFEIKEEFSGGLKVKLLIFSLGSKATRTNIEKQGLTLVFGLDLAPKLFGQ